MRGVGASYPKVDAGAGELINLGQRIDRCRREHMGAPALGPESAARLDLEVYVMAQSAGMEMNVATDGPAAPFLRTRRGRSTASAWGR